MAVLCRQEAAEQVRQPFHCNGAGQHALRPLRQAVHLTRGLLSPVGRAGHGRDRPRVPGGPQRLRPRTAGRSAAVGLEQHQVELPCGDLGHRLLGARRGLGGHPQLLPQERDQVTVFDRVVDVQDPSFEPNHLLLRRCGRGCGRVGDEIVHADLVLKLRPEFVGLGHEVPAAHDLTRHDHGLPP